MQAIDVRLVLDVLMQPVGRAADDDEKRLWWRKPETASRVRQRIEAVLDWARHRGYRDGENPARWQGNLEHSLPKKTKVRSNITRRCPTRNCRRSSRAAQ